jgi:hypothetical protein
MNENEQLALEIQGRIKQLEELSGTEIKTEMDDLKVVLLKNPTACQLLLPEDIGLMVACIKKLMLGARTLAEIKKPTGRKTTKPQIDLSADLSLEGF